MEPTPAEQAYRHIRRKLTDGELAPGKHLVNRILADEIWGQRYFCPRGHAPLGLGEVRPSMSEQVQRGRRQVLQLLRRKG